MKFTLPVIKAVNRVHQQASSGRVFSKPEMFKMCSGNDTEWSQRLWKCFTAFVVGDKAKYKLDPIKFNLVLAELQVYLKSLEQ